MDEYFNLNAIDDGQLNKITFSDSTIPTIETDFIISLLTNVGDINEDGADEIGFVQSAISRLCGYSVYSLSKANLWREILKVDYDASNPQTDIVRLDPDNKGYVIAKTVEWDDGDSVPVEKSIKIK